MESLIDPILFRILSYLNFYEVTVVSRVNKQFQRVRKQLILIKPPDGRLLRSLVKLDRDCYEGRSRSIVSSNNRFTCSGCSDVQIQRQQLGTTASAKEEEESTEEDEEDPKVQVCLILTAERGVIKSWGDNDGKKVTVLVRGFFEFDPDGQYDKMRQVLWKIHPGLEAMFCSLIFIGRVLDKIVNKLFSLVIEKSKDRKEVIVTLDKIREVIQIVFPGDLSKNAIGEGNKSINHKDRLVFDVNAVRSRILLKYSGIQLGIEPAIFMTTILEYICVELWELAGNAARDNRMDIVLVDHLIIGIETDMELRELIKLDQFDPLWLTNNSSQERLLKGTIKSDDSKYVVIETEHFPVRFENIRNAQALHLYDIHQNQTNPIEGVLSADGFIPSELHHSLLNNIRKLVANQFASDNHYRFDVKVRDLIHPELYSYIEGVSQFVPSLDLPSNTLQHDDNNPNRDLWGREYETSRFQFLPTYIDSQKDGSWRFRNEINNLPKEGNESLYQNLEQLFSKCIPYLEQVIGYARILGGKDQTAPELQFFAKDELRIGKEITGKTHIKPYKLNGKSLQVICKIVEIELRPGERYEGVWHVKGMPQENIIAITDYVTECDESLVGPDLCFKRGFLSGEVSALESTAQDGDSTVQNNTTENDMCPLGSVETKVGRLIIFPNSHVHKLSPIKNEGTVVAKRTNVIFYVINPEVRIISTQEVTPKSQKQIISHQEALQYRLELMEERKFYKQDWNVGNQFA